MDNSVASIPLLNLSLALIPALIVLIIMTKWSLRIGNAIYALSRMLGQLLIIGYFLATIFSLDNLLVIITIVAIMLCASSWISLDASKDQRYQLLLPVLISILLGAGSLLMLIIFGVLNLDPWYSPHYVIPLAGMLFANVMNSISLAAERYNSELKHQRCFYEARNAAFQAAMIPVMNSLFAVGLVSLPGMMTGQILAGVDPLIAARYQIMVMLMIFGSSGLAVACFLSLMKKHHQRVLEEL